jgi:nicotinic acid mononucleotide adenylyltransferase
VLDRTGLNTKHNYQAVHRKIDISATNIRKRVASGRSIRYLVPPAVEDIIRRQNLYREK